MDIIKSNVSLSLEIEVSSEISFEMSEISVGAKKFHWQVIFHLTNISPLEECFASFFKKVMCETSCSFLT